VSLSLAKLIPRQVDGACGTPRFSVYLRVQELARVGEEGPTRASGGPERVDRFEPSAACLKRLPAPEEAKPPAEVEEIERTRVRLESPAGRFLDLWV
jgi:hypothetical protein